MQQKLANFYIINNIKSMYTIILETEKKPEALPPVSQNIQLPFTI